MKRGLLTLIFGITVLLNYAQVDVTFNVTDRQDQAIENASVSYNNLSQATDINGQTVFSGVTNGTLPYTITATNYKDSTGSVLVSGSNVAVNVDLNNTYPITFYLVNEGDMPIYDAAVTFNGVTNNTDELGYAYFADTNGTLDYNIIHADYQSQNSSLTINSDAVNSELTLIGKYEVTFTTIAFSTMGSTEQTTVEEYNINSASVKLNGETKLSNSSGLVTFSNLYPGVFTYNAIKSDSSVYYRNGSIEIVSSNISEDVFMKIRGTWLKRNYSTNDLNYNVEFYSGYSMDYLITFTDQVSESSSSILRSNMPFGSGTSTAFNLMWLPGIQYGKTYDVTIDPIGGQSSSVTRTVTIGTMPTTSLTGNITTSTLDRYVDYWPVSGADNYQIVFTPQSGGSAISTYRSNMPYGSGTSTNFHLTWISGIKYGEIYDVKVRAQVNGTWGTYGSECALTISDIGPKLIQSDCGLTVSDLNVYLEYNALGGATNYEILFSPQGGGSDIITTRSSMPYGTGTSTNFHLSWIPGVEFGKTYNVQIKAQSNSVWGSYGDVCTITVSAPATKLTDTYCNTTVSDFELFLEYDAVFGATDYEILFSPQGGGGDITATRSSMPYGSATSTNFYLGWISGLEYGKVYDVQVRAETISVWGSYGSVCTLTTGSIPTTKLTDTYCNTSISDFNSYMYYETVVGAADYEVRFSPQGGGSDIIATRSSMPYGSATSPSFHLSWLTGLEYGKIYDVQVRALVNGVWGSYGPICTVTTNGTVPSTKLSDISCDITITNLVTRMYFDKVAGASNYELLFSPQGVGSDITMLRGDMPYGAANVRNFFPVWIPGLQYGEIYDVQVRAEVGSTWGAYGATCVLTINSSKSGEIIAGNGEENFGSENLEFVAYPNPFKEGFTLSLNDFVEQDASLVIFDITGRLVYQQNIKSVGDYLIGNDLSKGGYLVVVKTATGEMKTQKVFKTE